MQVINLKSGYEKAIPINILGAISQENNFVFLNDGKLGISYNLDISDMYGTPFGNTEDDFSEFLSDFENCFLELKMYFLEPFEIVYFTYTGEYSANMWSFNKGVLKNSFGWIGDFCPRCKSDSEKDDFVDQNYPLLKQGEPSSELLKGLRKELAKV